MIHTFQEDHLPQRREREMQTSQVGQQGGGTAPGPVISLGDGGEELGALCLNPTRFKS